MYLMLYEQVEKTVRIDFDCDCLLKIRFNKHHLFLSEMLRW